MAFPGEKVCRAEVISRLYGQRMGKKKAVRLKERVYIKNIPSEKCRKTWGKKYKIYTRINHLICGTGFIRASRFTAVLVALG